MKKVFLIFCIPVLLSFPLGMQAQVYVKKLPVKNELGNQLNNIVIHNNKGEQLKKISDYTFINPVTGSFSDLPLLISSCVEELNNNVKTKYSYEYDSNFNFKKAIYFSLKNSEWNAFYEEEKVYFETIGENHPEIKKEIFIWKSDTELIHRKIEKTYEQYTSIVVETGIGSNWNKPVWWDKSRISDLSIYEKANGSENWNLIQKIEYTYALYDFSLENANGKVPLPDKIISSCIDENNQLKRTSLIEYTYSGIDRSWDIYHGFFKDEVIYACDGNNNQLCMKTKTNTTTVKHDYFQNSNGILSNSGYEIEYYDNDGILIPNSREIIKYSNARALVDQADVVIMNTWTKANSYTTENGERTKVVDSLRLNHSKIHPYRYNREITSQKTEFMREESPAFCSDGWTKENGKDIYTVYNSIVEEGNSPQKLWSISVTYDDSESGTPTHNVFQKGYPRYAVFPNPVENELFVISSDVEKTSSSIKYFICNITGKLQKKGTLISEGEPIPVQSLAKGTYIITLSDNERSETSVFIKK